MYNQNAAVGGRRDVVLHVFSIYTTMIKIVDLVLWSQEVEGLGLINTLMSFGLSAKKRRKKVQARTLHVSSERLQRSRWLEVEVPECVFAE